MSAAPHRPESLASRLNDACHCIWVDRARLGERLREPLRTSGADFQPSLVSGSVVFLDPQHAAAMDRTIALIARAVASPAFERRISAAAPDVARKPQATLGGVLGFDFHVGGAVPQLIEVNTNPGGLLVSLEIVRAATSVCDCLSEPLVTMAAASVPMEDVAQRVADGFVAEWTRARGARPLRTIAIADDDPQGQFLFPEFLLYQRLLQQAGYEVLIADAGRFVVDGTALSLDGRAVDFVYNRCTDFYFAEERHAALREAYERDLAVITPHPAAHARWADKRLLAYLGDDALLTEAGLGAAERQHLRDSIPATEVVDPAQAEDLWARRKGLFFKPAGGFGSKAAYRGDRLTRTTFRQILAGQYVAQALAPTSFRRVPAADGEPAELRVDIRNFALAGETWLRAARLYRGQTTNFRTAGGGFAPVLTLPALETH